MLLVPAAILPSPIHGLGLFALRPIVEGARVAQWRPDWDLRFSPEEFAALSVERRLNLEAYVWHDADGFLYASRGSSRFLNHSATPNLRWDGATKTSHAAREIAIGEELTENYAEYDVAFSTYAHELNGGDVLPGAP